MAEWLKRGKAMENVIIVGVENQTNYKTFDESMKELANLTETAYGNVVGELIQKRQQIDRRTIIGKGKIDELLLLIEEKEADTVIFNHELSSRQNRLIEERIDVKVLDRVQLILDIFAMRAKSKEGQLQVELAQLNYLLPRLSGQGLSLSKLGGGIGTRGPGETKLETDRRHIRKKITIIKKELNELADHRERSRKKRNDSCIFRIGLVGYTNAGKSTIMNLLTNTNTYAKNQLFATLDPLTKKWQLPDGFETTLTDTVGFIQDLPTSLIEAFQSTLEESKNVDLLLHVVDATAENRLQQEKTVIDLLDKLKMEDIPVLTVYNKADLMQGSDFVPTLFPNCLISAVNDKDKEKLTEAIIAQIKTIFKPVEIVLNAKESHLLTQLSKRMLIDSSVYLEDDMSYEIKGYANTHFDQIFNSSNRQLE